jgi:arsenate reductase
MVPPGGIRGGRPSMRGGSNPRKAAAVPAPPQTPATPTAGAAAKKRVLFVCIGNSCRSQMAEGFARAYGADVMAVQSAGLSPAVIVAPLTRTVLAERNIRIDGQFPKSLEMVLTEPFDIIVNMSGIKLAAAYSSAAALTIEWPVPDPIGEKEEVYRSVAEQIEGWVMRLILELRSVPK